jgi:hypothetical protein
MQPGRGLSCNRERHVAFRTGMLPGQEICLQHRHVDLRTGTSPLRYAFCLQVRLDAFRDRHVAFKTGKSPSRQACISPLRQACHIIKLVSGQACCCWIGMSAIRTGMPESRQSTGHVVVRMSMPTSAVARHLLERHATFGIGMPPSGQAH